MKYYALATSQDNKSQDVDLKYINQPELDLQQELTKFENDDNVITQTEPAPDVINPPEATVHTDMRDHSIISFLQRPQILYESSIASGSRSQILQDFRVPEALFNSMIVDKLRGFTSFKATAVIRVQLQSQPFMCGRLLLSAIPMPDLIATRSDFISSNVSRLMLLNNVQADVAKDTDMELKIPFISPYTCYDLISSRWSWSRVVLSLYSPINTIGNLPLDYIVYGHFENIELGAPTSGDFGQFKAQGGIGTQKKLGKSDVSRTQTIEKRPTTISGKLSGIAAGVSGVSDNLGSLLPFLNPVTSVVSGISNTIGSGIASLGKLLGFSKVLNPVFPVEVVNRAVVNFATTDSVDVSQSLSLMRDVNVPPIAGLTGTQTDELSFDFLKKIPQFIDSFSFSNNTVVGNSIWQIAVHPSLLLKGSSIAFSSRIFDSDFDIKTKVYPTPIPQVTHLSYICSPFKYWKGSLTYTFKFVKTDFHSGRVEISYHPFTNYTDQINRSDYVYRVIVDLREKSEVSVCIPFFSQSPFKRVSVPLDIRAQYSQYAFYSTGTLVVKALTPLKYSAVVSNTIECLVEISAGDDFEVSCPNESKIIPFAFDKYLPTPVFKAESGFLSAAHQLNPRQEAIEQKESSITGNELDVSSTSLQRELNGEVFVNYRSFIKRNSWYSKIKFVANPSGEVFSESIPVRDLIAAPILRGGLLTYLYDTNAVNLDKAQYLAMYVLNMRPTPLSFVSGMYAFHRGGIRVKTYSFDGVNSIALKYVTYSEDDSDPVTQSLQFNSPQGVEQTSLKIIGEFQVPYYGLSFMASHYKDTESFFISRPRNRVKIVSDTGKPVSVAVSGADDLDFMVFLGTPPSLTTKFASGGKNVSYVKKGDPDINATGFLPSLRFGDSAVNADPWFRIIQEEDPQGNNIFIQPEFQKAVYLNDYVFK